MDLVLFTIILLICAVMFGIAIYYVVMRVKDLNVQPLIFIAIILGFIEIMIISMVALCLLKISGLV